MTLALLFALLLALAIALLAVPVDLRVASRHGDPRWRVQIEWLFGRVHRELGSGERKPRDGEDADWRDGLRRVQRLWASELRPALIELARELWRRTHVHALRAHLRLGLGDPAETGMAMAALAPIAELLGARPNVDVQVEPDFIEEGLDSDVDGAVRIVPIRWLRPLLAFACSPGTLRAAWALRR